ncbi:hypothetical protein [Ensifer aridi]|nr:hypothetical protein [Ensifer aridi]
MSATIGNAPAKQERAQMVNGEARFERPGGPVLRSEDIEKNTK